MCVLGAVASAGAAGGLTMTIKKSSVVKDDVADIGFWAGTDVPAQKIIAPKLNHEDGHLLQVLDVVGCSYYNSSFPCT